MNQTNTLDLFAGVVALFATIIASLAMFSRLPFGPNPGFTLRQDTVVLLFWVSIPFIVLAFVAGAILVGTHLAHARRARNNRARVFETQKDK